MFENRKQAGLVLARKIHNTIDSFDPNNTLVLGLPRGGVIVACEIALSLSCPLDVWVAKKIGAPDQPELALGAVGFDGTVVMNDSLDTYINTITSYIDAQTNLLLAKTKESQNYWRQQAQLKEPLVLRDKLVIVIDDGVATGMTALAAVRGARQQGASSLIFAAPVMADTIYEELQSECAFVIALETPHKFGAIGQFYRDFHQIEDDEVIAALKQCKQNSPMS